MASDWQLQPRAWTSWSIAMEAWERKSWSKSNNFFVWKSQFATSKLLQGRKLRLWNHPIVSFEVPIWHLKQKHSRKSLLVSNATKPVTQTALVVVKSASIRLIFFVVDIGNNSRIVPIKIRPKKLSTNNRAGVNPIYFNGDSIIYSLQNGLMWDILIFLRW